MYIDIKTISVNFPNNFYKKTEKGWYKKCVKCDTFKQLTTINFYKINSEVSELCKKCYKIPRIKHFNEAEELFCSCCKNYLSVDNFYKGPIKRYKQRNGRERICKTCQAKKLESKIIDVKTFLRNRWQSAKNRSKNKTSLKTKLFELTLEELYNLYDKQNGKCAITNIEMTYLCSKNELSNISIDRIDNNKGYSKDNIQLICSIVNTMKNLMSIEELKHWCKLIIYPKQ